MSDIEPKNRQFSESQEKSAFWILLHRGDFEGLFGELPGNPDAQERIVEYLRDKANSTNLPTEARSAAIAQLSKVLDMAGNYGFELTRPAEDNSQD